tara:strand:+ start:59 stop:502 length:444 start_codon:yes stop_codon:yes gene_type:complete
MTSIHLYQAEKKDIQELNYLIYDWKEKHLTHCNFPELDNAKVNFYLNTFLKIGKIICIKDLDKDKLVGCLVFHKSEYWFSKQNIIEIEMIYVQPQFRNYKLFKQLIDMVKKVSENNPIVLSTTTKLDIDPVFEKLGFENMGSNWRLM